MNKKQAEKQLSKLVDLKSLPRMQARVEIAKDVIAALKLKKLQAAHEYMSLYNKLGDMDSVNGSLRNKFRDDISTGNTSCHVCAIGACFAGVVARDNEFIMYNNSEVSRNTMLDELSNYFSRDELYELEHCYEQWGDSKFFDIKNDTDRMIAIMQSIVENKGELCL